MPEYYVNSNQQANGDNEVHRSDEEGCQNPAAPRNRVDLGWHSDCHGAVRKAKSMRFNANGSYYCAYACHTT